MSRNIVSDETAERNRSEGRSGYTFNARPEADYEGRIVLAEAIRLGDHAHVTISSGRQTPMPASSRETTFNYGTAGRLILAWDDWLVLREILAADPRTIVSEVENPTPEMLVRYAG